jgi:hypothetical protein
MGQEVAQLVEALRYKMKGGGFDSGWCPSHRIMTRSRLLTEMGTRNISWRVKAAGA